jgi:hypothetical protein
MVGAGGFAAESAGGAALTGAVSTIDRSSQELLLIADGRWLASSPLSIHPRAQLISSTGIEWGSNPYIIRNHP